LNLLQPFINPKSCEIPAFFHSTALGHAFDHCVMCNQYLLDPMVQYFVEKAIRNYRNIGASDTIFEYAICVECAGKMKEQLSRDSLAKVAEFFSSGTDLYGRWATLTKNDNYSTSDWTSYCVMTGKHKDELNEYQIYAHCEGDRMLFSLMPYMISEEAILTASELLSAKTKDELDRFTDKFLGPPPEIRELWKDHRPAFIF
jgi:hypothetical protein